MEYKTDVVLFSKSALEIEILQKALKTSVTRLADSTRVRKDSVLQVPNALATLRGETQPIRDLAGLRDNGHVHVSLLCVLPRPTMAAVLEQADGLFVTKVLDSHEHSIVLLSGTLDRWALSIRHWLNEPSHTLREYTTKVINILNGCGANIVEGVKSQGGLYYLEHKR